MSETPAKLSASELWKLDGTISRRRYLGLGASLCVIKYGIDSAVSWFVFHRAWSALDYFMPGQPLDAISNSPELRIYYLTMLVLALPFIWFGVALTLRRLRGADLPTWLVKLFFVPAVNLLLFFVLSVLPSRGQEETLTKRLTEQPVEKTKIAKPEIATPARVEQGFLARVLPKELLQEDRLPGGLLAVLLPQPAAYALVYFGTIILRSYGWGLFVGIPFALGMSSVVLYGRSRQRKLVECLVVSWIALIGMSGLLFMYGAEGAVCLAMASPIAFTIASMGAILGWAVQRRPALPGKEPTLLRLSILLFLPFLMGAEYAVTPPAPLFAVRSTIDIQAPPAVVWNNVVSFSKLPPPTEFLFRTGIAYPVRAIIYGHGPGAIRHCIFSTGPFIEPIQVWDEPRLLRFSVSSQPQPMFEYSIRKNIDPPHLDGFLTSRQGQFLLTPLPNGGTRLEGTTWYQHHMWPAGYWRLWSDAIIHQIHMRVLVHIKHLSEERTS